MTDAALQAVERARELEARMVHSRELCAVAWRLKQDMANVYCVCARNRIPGLMRRHGMTRQQAAEAAFAHAAGLR